MKRPTSSTALVVTALAVVALVAVVVPMALLRGTPGQDAGGTRTADSASVPGTAPGDARRLGTIERISYSTRTRGSAMAKEALVYLPAGYDAQDTTRRYPILYLLHGALGDENGFFGGPGRTTPLKTVLDRMIDQQRIAPTIVVTPTYYPQGQRGPVGGDYHADRALNAAFPAELTGSLMPAVEGRFHTFARTVDAAGFRGSRDHRAFGGFSMGAITTWYVFTEDLQYFRYFMPMAGDSWVVQDTGGATAPAATAAALDRVVQRSGFGKDDFLIAASVGSADGTTAQMRPQIDAMRDLPRSFDASNLRYALDQGGGHDAESAVAQLERALALFF